MKKKVAAMAIAAIMAVSVLNGCSSSDMGAGRADDQSVGKTSDEGRETSSSGEKITLNLYWWGNQTRNDVTKKAIDLYMEKNPNIEIKAEFTDWSGYWDKLSAMAVICQILFSRIIAILTSIRRVDSWQILRHLLRMAPLIQLIFLTASLRAVLLMGNVMPSVLEAMPLLWFMIRRLQRKLGL